MPRPTDVPKVDRQFDISRWTTTADIEATFDEIIDWSIEANTTIGYFAVIYKQATVAIHRAIDDGKFVDPARMMKFQLAFGRRYVEALNSYNSREPFTTPTHVWKRSFDGCEMNEPILFQHLLTGLNAHMNLDLGVAAAEVGRGSMPTLRQDFNVVNAVLGYQVEGVLTAISEISPFIGRMFDCIVGESRMFRALIIIFRELAWRFAVKLTEEPIEQNARRISRQDTRYDDLGDRYIYTPSMFGFLVEKIAAEESRDIVNNIRALNSIPTPGWDQITEYQGRLEDTRAKVPKPEDEDAFFEKYAQTLRVKAREVVGS